MPILGKPAVAVAAGLVMLAVGPATASIAAPRAAESPPAVAGGTSASAPPAQASIDLTFDVKNLQGSLDVQFNPAGILSDDGGLAMARSGTMDAVYPEDSFSFWVSPAARRSTRWRRTRSPPMLR